MKLKRLASILFALALMATALPLFEQTAQAASAYYIEVDITNQIVTVFLSGDHTESGIVRQMICSTGKSGTSTPRGTFTLPNKRYSTERTEWHRVNGAWAQWCTRIVNGILFHSLPVSSKNSPPSAATVAALGTPASHGCVRLRVRDAKWIALNCPAGTKVKIYKSGKRNDELRKLLLDGEFYVANESYEEYLGIAGALGKGDSGEKVLQLQARLNLLGYNAGAADGVFGADTHSAVCAFQKACGLTQNGRVTEKLWNRIFADDAPVAPIASGSSGVHVLALQTALQTLKLYDGELTGVYDDATANAVRVYQGAFGLTVDGNATASVQKSILAKAEQVKEQFGDGEYKAVVVSTSKQLAKVKVSSSLNLRASASTSSKSLAKLKNGAIVTVLKKGSSWSQVQSGSLVGYCKNSYLKFYTESATTLSYETVEPEPTVDPNATPTPTADPNAPTPEPTASSETLTVGSTGDAVANLQSAMKVLKLYGGEVTGTYDPATADAVKTFQSASGLTADGEAGPAVQDAIRKKARAVKDQFGDADYQPVISTTSTTVAKVKVSSSLNLRASASTSSKSLAKLKNGAVVTVLKKGSSWSQVDANGIVGYCKNSYLKFSTVTSTTLTYEPAPEPTPEPTATPEPTPTPTIDPNATPAPVLSQDPLTVGADGDAVRTLQRSLKTLKLYGGEITGTYDQTTADAVKTFQSVSGLTADGKATAAVQKAILEKAGEIERQFADGDYQPVISTTSTTLAKVKVNSSLNLRASASTSSKSLAKLKNGTIVTVLKKGSSWSQVDANGIVGYCKNSYLIFSTVTSSTLTYEPAPTLEPTPLPDADATATPDPENPDATASAEPTSPSNTESVPGEDGENPGSDADNDEPTSPSETESVPGEDGENPGADAGSDEPASPSNAESVPGEDGENPGSDTGNDEPASPSDAESDPAKPSEPLYAVVKADAKLYRAAEISDAGIAGDAPAGTVYDVIETDSQWTQVRANGKVCFILTRDVDIVKTKPAPKPAAQPSEESVAPAASEPAAEPASEPSQIPAETSEEPAAEEAA